MRNLLQDLRFAFRQFRKSPGFVITAILSLMLGIGATTAIFSVVHGVLLDPYPYKNNDRMVHVQLNDKNGRGPLLFVNATGSKELRQTKSIEDFFLQNSNQQNLTGDQVPTSVNVGSYSPNLFEFMGVPPLLGREFTEADAPNGSAAPVAVLSYLFWQRQFGGSRDVVGKTLELDHKIYTVIGVVPPRFTWGDSDVYLPEVLSADPHEYRLSFVRLKPGTKFPAAEAEFQVLADEFAKQDKNYPQDRKVKIVTLNEEVLGKFAGTLTLLFGAVLALLIIGCANVSILLLARGTARQHELAVRVSVGAGRILFGVSPAWQLSRPQLVNLIQANSAKHSGSTHNRNTHRLLIAGQVALTLVLLAAAGAAMRAFVARIHTPLGFEPDHVIAMNIGFPKGANPTWEGRVNANELVRKTVTEVPGVDTASVSTTWFPGFGGFTAKIEVQGKPSLTDAQAVLCLASPQEFLTLRIPLLAGRVYDEAETMRAAHFAVVNQSFVKQFIGDGDPFGQSVRSPMLKFERPSLLLASAPDEWLQIIGVVGDARNDGLDHPIKPAIFLPYSFVLPPDEALLVRATGNTDVVLRAIKERLRQLNPEMVVGNTHTLMWWLETQGWGQERFIATLFSLFAVLALALAATGLYSVVSFAVNQRTQEVGIRMALGAPRTSIIRLVLASTGTMLGFGLAIGLGLSVALNKVVVSWANGSSRDPLTLLASALLLLLVAVARITVGLRAVATPHLARVGLTRWLPTRTLPRGSAQVR